MTSHTHSMGDRMLALQRTLTQIAVFIVAASAPGMAIAGIIGVGDFGPGTSIVNYEGLGLVPGSFNFTPLVIGGDTYTVLQNPGPFGSLTIANFGFPGQGPMQGLALATSHFIDIVFATPVFRAGGNVAEFLPWSASVSFFDESDALLGTVDLSGLNYPTAGFAGWEADSGLIRRMRITSTSTSNIALMVVDNLMKEASPSVAPVPEPASLATWGLGAIVMATLGRRLRKKAAG